MKPNGCGNPTAKRKAIPMNGNATPNKYAYMSLAMAASLTHSSVRDNA